jgi:hypothetical protein
MAPLRITDQLGPRSIVFPYPDQAGSNRSVTYRRGNYDSYVEDEVVRMGAEILYLEVETWTCPLCEGKFPKNDRAAVIRAYNEKCRLQEHSVGYECLAFRQESKAKELLVEKLEDEVRRLESGSMRTVEASGDDRMADVSKSRIGKLKLEIARIKTA